MKAETIHSITVQKLPVQAAIILADMPGLAESLQASVIENEIGATLISLRGYVLSEQHEPRAYEVKHWASWWDHFKADVFPAWLLERFPAEEVVDFVVEPIKVRCCPHLAVKTPESDHLNFMAKGQP